MTTDLIVFRPNRGTQTERVLHHLELGVAICPTQVGYTSRLAARIHDLRMLGWPIVRGWCNVSYHTHSSKVASYRLEWPQ